MEFKKDFDFGDLCKDVVTGFKGIVIAYTQHATGCDTVGLQPQGVKDGKTVDAHWFDLTRVKLIERGAVEIANREKLTTKERGGPRQHSFGRNG